MKIVSAEQLQQKDFADFFEDKWTEMSEKKGLVEYGYFVENKGDYQAYFALFPLESSKYWLKSLYIKEGAPTTYPFTILETCVAIVREKGASGLYVYSHQDALDFLLESLGFELCDHPPAGAIVQEPDQIWWQFQVS